jgi:hypothetical protein
MSDRDLGLMSSITSNLIRCICLRHFFKNLKLRYRGQGPYDLFFVAAYTHDELLFDSKMFEIHDINLNFVDDCVATDISSWANSKCSLPKYGKTTSNSAESMNSAIKKPITTDITNLIVSLNNANIEIFNTGDRN